MAKKLTLPYSQEELTKLAKMQSVLHAELLQVIASWDGRVLNDLISSLQNCELYKTLTENEQASTNIYAMMANTTLPLALCSNEPKEDRLILVDVKPAHMDFAIPPNYGEQYVCLIFRDLTQPPEMNNVAIKSQLPLVSPIEVIRNCLERMRPFEELRGSTQDTIPSITGRLRLMMDKMIVSGMLS